VKQIFISEPVFTTAGTTFSR